MPEAVQGSFHRESHLRTRLRHPLRAGGARGLPRCGERGLLLRCVGFIHLQAKEHHMALMRHLFTSESVTEGHPDKIADQISDAILDAVLAEDPVGRVACETLVTTGLAMISGEITTRTYVDFPSIVRNTIREIGYTRATSGFHSETHAVTP